MAPRAGFQAPLPTGHRPRGVETWGRQRALDCLRAPTLERVAATTCCADHGEQHSRRAFLSSALHFGAAVSLTSSAPARHARAVITPEEAAAAAAGKPVWGYVGDIGPDSWGSLNPDWSLCDAGRFQSPVELSYKRASFAGTGELSDFERPTMAISRSKFALKKREALPFAACKSLIVEPYVPPPPVIVGDAPPIDLGPKNPPAAVLTVPQVGRYNLVNIHFHTGGSEHVVNGSRARMEAHLVFKMPRAPRVSDADLDDPRPEPRERAGSSLAVVAVLVARGEKSSPWIRSILENSIDPPSDEVLTGAKVVDLDLAQVVPDFNRAGMFTYDGSLTTPPGTEGVHWIVLEERASVTEKDCMLLEKFQGGPNTRPLQELGDRRVVQFTRIEGESETKTIV